METPGLGRRFAALFIDWIVAYLVVTLVTGTDYAGANAAPWFYPLIGFWVVVTLQLGTASTTLGKRILRIRVIDADGGPIGFWRAALRTTLLVLVLPAVVITEDRRGLHDMAAGTMVVAA